MDESILNPLFTIELLLEPFSLQFSPNNEDFHDGIGEIIGSFQDTALSVANLVPDPYFDAFTR